MTGVALLVAQFSGRIPQRLAGEPVALVENRVDRDQRMPPPAGGAAGAQRAGEFQAFGILWPRQRPREPARLARQIVERGPQGKQPAGEMRRIGEAVAGRLRRWRKGERACCALAEEGDARLRPNLLPRALRRKNARTRIEQAEGGNGLGLLRRADKSRRHRARRLRLCPDGFRQKQDQPPHGGFGRTQRARDGAVQGFRDANGGGVAVQAEHRKQPGDDVGQGCGVWGDALGKGQGGSSEKRNERKIDINRINCQILP